MRTRKRSKLFCGLLFSALAILAVNSFAVWDVQTVDTTGDVGWYSSLALDSGNHPMISYYDYTNNRLKYAYHNGSAWSVQTVGATAGGNGTSIARNSSNYPCIAFRTSASELRYTEWTGSAWSSPTLVGTSMSSEIPSPSLKLDASQRPHVTYVSSGSLRYGYFNGTSWGVSSLPLGNDPQEHSLALDTGGVPHVAAYNNDKEVSYYNGPAGSWTANKPTGQGNNEGAFLSLALDTSGNPHISACSNTISTSGADYVNYRFLQYFYFNGSSWTKQKVDNDYSVGGDTSIATQGTAAHISYLDFTRWHLKYATNSSGAWIPSVVDASGAVGFTTSLKLDSSGSPAIAYYDVTNKDLKFARWIEGVYTISGVVRDGASVPKAGVYMFLTSGAIHANTVTKSDGSYVFEKVPAGNVSVIPVLAGWSFSPTQRTYAPLGQNQTSQDFTIIPGSGYFIRGYITDAAGNQVGKQVIVTLSGGSQGTYTTDTTGYYEFVNLSPGNYTITPSLTGYSFTPATRSYASLGASQDSQGFAAMLPGVVYTAQGTVRNSQGVAVPNITVQARGNSISVAAITGSNGQYVLTGLPYEPITLEPQAAGWVFEPARKIYTAQALAKGLSAEDFIAVKGSVFPQEVKIIGGLFKPLLGEHASIWYTLPQPGNVVIKLYSLDGVMVKALVDGRREAGVHQEIWTGVNKDNQTVASGIYFVDIQLPGVHTRKKICVVK